MWNVEQENRVFSLLNGKKIQLEPSTINLKDYIKNLRGLILMESYLLFQKIYLKKEFTTNG